MSLVQIGPERFDPKAGPPCHRCTARCCKYFALEIDAPRTPKEHDHIRWFLVHQHVVVWVQDGSWFLEVRTPCRHLQADNSCGIYHARPQICRDHGWPEAAGEDEPCEYFTGEGGYDLCFETPAAFEAWSRVELRKREERLARRREAARRAKGGARRADREAIA